MRTFDDAVQKTIGPFKSIKGKKAMEAFEAFQKAYDFTEDIKANEIVMKIAERFAEATPECCIVCICSYARTAMLSGFQLGLAVGIEMEKCSTEK